ncbi:MAG: FAD-dependent oxidoreductase, partial [Candidatus Eisenbacteria bacterium]|nr:FAD-dependent oxidoreductase [Candidatus Eisenbacteria bacterium]
MSAGEGAAGERCEEVVIVGGGPAGIAAALQLRRYGIDPLLIERTRLGGLLWNAYRIENYPALPDALPGPELAQRLALHLRRAQVRLLGAEVRGVGFAPTEDEPSRRRAEHVPCRRLRLTTSAGEIDTRRLLVATGTEARRPASPRVPPAAIERVHSEILALRDLRDARVAIIGGGDAACDYAL